ncbi:hypothetical protein QBC33DRAFT_523090 [Phialemonium atrogriseum]|uniref:Secreted protein n=1 Tax=Phialemonium atrogriseum TaxID=1093897 RepID=A0AAJ0FUC4_9PEZI|nr:uncharacterized protein QBC33DRAFT_523090 [Phialemonium atrogriseum]KAK1772995.1 hypothetical protein QBC33DRAFT_523090 [Phialemonium atrogriseum]
MRASQTNGTRVCILLFLLPWPVLGLITVWLHTWIQRKEWGYYGRVVELLGWRIWEMSCQQSIGKILVAAACQRPMACDKTERRYDCSMFRRSSLICNTLSGCITPTKKNI